MIKVKFLAVFMLMLFLMPASEFGKTGANLLNLMPVPEQVDMREGKFRVTKTFTSAIEAVPGAKTRRTARAVRRMLNRLAGRTGLFLTKFLLKRNRRMQLCG